MYNIDGDGYVVGVLTASGLANEASFTGSIANAANLTSLDYSTFTINQYGPDGVTPLTAGGTVYSDSVLYLSDGDLEVVPEPGTWTMMLGGLALLVICQRRRKV